MADILTSVKSDLGISSTAKDDEITAAISAAKTALRIHGVNQIVDTDPLTAIAIKFYVRSFFNFQGDSERHQKAFEAVADAMALTSDYNEEE